jgi:hypothetical protein
MVDRGEAPGENVSFLVIIGRFILNECSLHSDLFVKLKKAKRRASPLPEKNHPHEPRFLGGVAAVFTLWRLATVEKACARDFPQSVGKESK